MSTHTAVITGSTSGLGAAFARQLAAQGFSLVLVARDRDRLEGQSEALSSQYGVRAAFIVADLVTDDGVNAVQERLSDPAKPVHLLVNNAGHGLAEDFVHSTLDAERDLLRLHVQTTLELSHTAARSMSRRHAGRIINVASVAGFTPTSTYSAAKAWVINFSKALHQQLRGEGVAVTALCPGLVRTEFHPRSGIKIRGAKRWMWLDPEDVVRQGLAANAQGSAMCIPSRSYQMLTSSLKFVPDSMVQWAVSRRSGSSSTPQRTLEPGDSTSATEPTGAAQRSPSGADEDRTADPTTGAIRTVDAYKASRMSLPRPPRSPSAASAAADSSHSSLPTPGTVQHGGYAAETDASEPEEQAHGGQRSGEQAHGPQSGRQRIDSVQKQEKNPLQK